MSELKMKEDITCLHYVKQQLFCVEDRFIGRDNKLILWCGMYHIKPVKLNKAFTET